MRFCDNCGHALEQTCTVCGFNNRAGARFCNNCGNPLPGAAEAGNPPAAGPRASQAVPPQADFQPASPSLSSAQPAIPNQSERLRNLIPSGYADKLHDARRQGVMEGERRIVTILFCDAQGSTAAASQLDPEEWTEIINGAFERMISPVYKYEGIVARLMGDAILAFFGAPIAHEDDPTRAVLAGLEIVEAMLDYCDQVKKRWGVMINTRVGINTGLVVVGKVGNDLQMEYTAMGDAINLASRMEQSAEPGTVQIGEDTYKLVSPYFVMQDLGEMHVKGKGQPVHTYRPLSARSQPGRLRGLESQGLSSPLVGREAELNLLSQKLDALRSGRGALLQMVGEAGLGKSRLVSELRRLDQENGKDGLQWLEGQSVSYRQSSSFYLWRQVVRQSVEAQENDPPELVRQKILEHCTCSSLPEGDIPFIETLLAVESENTQSAIRGYEGEALEHRITEAMRGLLTGKAQEQATVIVLDDLHWADAASLNLLVNLADLVRLYPLFIIGLLRPDKDAGSWKTRQRLQDKLGSDYHEISLAPLTGETSRRLLSNLLSFDDLPEEIRKLILKKAEGNPFYVEEVIRSLIESGILVRQSNGRAGRTVWRAIREVDQINLPENLQTLLIARIDQLDEEARRTLQLASVIGRSFYFRVLEAINQAATQGHDGLEKQLSSLERAELILKAGFKPELEYTFRHSITQEAAYNTILVKQRREFHRQVGETIEKLYAGRLEDWYAVLAYHYGEAQDERQAQYASLAGDLAFRLNAIKEAIDLYSQALRVLLNAQQARGPAQQGVDTPAERLKYVYLRLGRCHELQSDYPGAVRLYEEMNELARRTDDKAMELAALIATATAFAIPTPMQDARKSGELAGKALELAQQLGDRAAEAKVYWVMEIMSTYSGHTPEAVPFGEKSVALSRELGLREQLAYALEDLTFPLISAGRIKEAMDYTAEAMLLWQELGNLPMLVEGYTGRMYALILQGEFEQAMQIQQEAYEISERIGNHWSKVNSLFFIAVIYHARGEFSRALRHIQDSLPLAIEVGHPGMGFMWVQLVWVYQSIGDLQNAQLTMEQALDATLRFPPFMAMSQVNAAILYMKTGELEKAVEFITRVESSEFQRVLLDIEFALNFARIGLEDLHGDPEASLAYCARMVQRIHETGAIFFLPEVLTIQGSLLIKLGRRAEARVALEEGEKYARRLQYRIVLWRNLVAQAALAQEQSEGAHAGQLIQEAAEVVRWIGDQIEDQQLQEKFQALVALEAPQVGALVSSN